MAISISEFYNIKKKPVLSLEEVNEKLRISKKALDKLNVIKTIKFDRNLVAKEMSYVNAILAKPIKISSEDADAEVTTKIENAELQVSEIIADLTNQHDTIVMEELEIVEQKAPEEQPKEIEPIVKYPLNEKTLTTYAITTPNLLNATAAVVTKKGDVINKEVGEGSVVSTAKVLLDDIATRKELVTVAKETYDEKLPLIDNAVKFFNSSAGNKWLLSKEGNKWINYVIYKKNLSLEDSSILPQEDYDVFAKEDDDDLETIIAMEAKSDIAELDTLTESTSEVEADKDEEQTLAELSDNADKISRLEDEMTLVAAGIDSIDNIQADQSITVESAVYYNKVLNRIKSEAANHIGLSNLEVYEISKEEAEFDPAGKLTIAREGLVEVLQSIYEFFKKMIMKVINWIKRYFGKVSISSKLQTAKAKSLLNKLSKTKDLTKDKFDTIQVKLVEKYRPLLYLIDFDLSKVEPFLTSIVKNPIRKTIQDPLKQIYNVLNKLNSDINNNKKEELLNDANAIAKIMSKENIVDKALGNRSKFIEKLDKKVEGKKKEDDIIPLICSWKGGYGLIIEETQFGGETLYKYNLQSIKFTTLEGIFNKLPTKEDIKSALTKASLSSNDSSIIYKEMETVINYGKSFIESFKKFKKNSWGDTAGSKEVSSAISSIVSYAKAVTIQYVVQEISAYTANCKAVNKICEQIINVMD